LQNLIELFEGTYKWCMTATPFDKNSGCLINMINFVTHYTNSADSTDIFLNKNICDYIKKKFFRRNTKQSIKSEYSLPPLRENIIWLDFSRTEWAIYNAYLANPNVEKFSVLLRQICCYPKLAEEVKVALSNCKTLEDVEKSMVNHYKVQMNTAHNKVNAMESHIARYKTKIKIFEWKRQIRLLKDKKYRIKVEFHDKLETKIELVLDENDPDYAILMNNDKEVDNPFEDDIDSDTESDDERELMIVSDENQKKIMKILEKVWDKDFPQYLLNMYDQLKVYEAKLNELKTQYNGKKSTFDFYNDVMKRVKNIEEKHAISDSDSSDSDSEDEADKCGVCCGVITSYDLGVTKCGHIYCFNCVKPYIDKNNKCPTCNKGVKPSEIYRITKATKEEKKDANFKDKINLINKIGTKLANLIFFLKKTNEHTIIFSQWDDLLKVIGEVLDEHGIKNIFCRGNVWQRDKAIREFNTNDKIKVIMLSSDGAASGTNLTRAKKVILVDPVYGTYEQRRNVEWQAIGRAYRMGQTANVEVVRFIIRSSIEEEIYNMNKIENDKLVEELKIFETTGDTINLENNELEELNNAIKTNETKKKSSAIKKIIGKISKETNLNVNDGVDDLEDLEDL